MSQFALHWENGGGSTERSFCGSGAHGRIRHMWTSYTQTPKATRCGIASKSVGARQRVCIYMAANGYTVWRSGNYIRSMTQLITDDARCIARYEV